MYQTYTGKEGGECRRQNEIYLEVYWCVITISSGVTQYNVTQLDGSRSLKPTMRSEHPLQDRRGLAYVRAAPSTSVLTSDIPATTSTPSRTTEWRHRKAAATEEVQNLPRPPKTRKEYSCRICNEPMNNGYETAYREGHSCYTVDKAVKRYKSHRRVSVVEDST